MNTLKTHSKKYTTVLQRNDNFNNEDGLPKRTDLIEDPVELEKQVIHLEYVLSKYNFILSEYQAKYGNELFNEIETELFSHQNKTEMFKGEYSFELRKVLVQNVALIKEYEKAILNSEKTAEFYKNEFSRIQLEAQKLVQENDQLREELEKTKEEHHKIYRELMESGGATKLTPPIHSPQTEWMELNNVLKNQKEHLLQSIEKTRYELENYKNSYTDIREKYETLLNDYKNLDTSYDKLKTQYEYAQATSSYAEKKMKENTHALLDIEKRLNTQLITNEKLISECKMYKGELEHYKEIYEELERRKNSEVEVLMREISEKQNLNNSLKTKVQLLEDENSNVKFENNRLKSENEVLRYDCDKLSKILDESNFAVKSAEEKENHIDEVVRSYKRKVEDAHLEKEKLRVKLNMVESNFGKIQSEYMKLLQESRESHNKTLLSSQEKYEQILSNKEEEISNLKNDLLSVKIERDKYFTEYSILAKEYEKFSFTFREENDKYIKKYEESEKTANRIHSHSQEKINNLIKKAEKLEHEKMMLETELIEIRGKFDSKDSILNKMTKSEEAYAKELTKLKERSQTLEKEKEYLSSELERERNLHEKKLKHLKEQCDLRITVMENTMKYQRDQYEQTENKAYEMLKKQENITDKFKEEYYNTVNYYENIIQNMVADKRKCDEMEEEAYKVSFIKDKRNESIIEYPEKI